MTPRPTSATLSVVLVAAILVLTGCGKKDEDSSAGGGGGGGSAGTGRAAEPGVPAPPSSGPRAFGRAARTESKDKLKQIGMALHNYHDAIGSLPAGYYDKSGKLILSWRVALLPYIEGESVYQQFRLDEPWDSEHNKKLIRKMPKVFVPPGTSDTRGYTYYRAFTGPDTVFRQFKPATLPEKADPQIGRPARGLMLTGITDGTSNTAIVAEAYDPVVWTKPDELEYDPKKPVPRVGGSVLDEGYQLLFADGTVRYFDKPIPDKTLRALITATGGETVQAPD